MTSGALSSQSGRTVMLWRNSWNGWIPATASDPLPRVDPATIIADCYGTHDAVPRGVPEDYSWRLDSDANPYEADMDFLNYGALNIWGQVFAVTTGELANYNVRLQSRDPRMYFFDGSRWDRAGFDPGGMGGAYYRGTFLDLENVLGGSVRGDGDGMYSVPLSHLYWGADHDAYHWWWEGMYPRVPIPVGCQGVLGRQEMRLIPDDGYSDTVGAMFMGNCGIDEFETPETIVHPQGWNPGISQSRMKWITDQWQTFYITSVTSATLTDYPPPIPDLS